MFSSLTVAISSCIAVFGCNSNTQIAAKSNFAIAQVTNNIEQLSKSHGANNLRQDILISSILSQGYKNFMTLTKSESKNAYGNPIYKLKLYVDGSEYASLNSVSGRHNTQDRNRDLSGTEAPLPNKSYKVSSQYIRGSHPEVGGRFLPIYPRFETGRTDLGIHYDPSYEKSIEEDGTAGCIALTNKYDFDIVLDYVRQYPPQLLYVHI